MYPVNGEGSGYVCKKCKRGNSSDKNEIVFCDSCNTPYHQLCHNPPIDQIVVAVREARWFCNQCEAKQKIIPLETGQTGENLEPEVRMAYLASLSKSQLIQLIRYAETQYPTLPIYSPRTQELYEEMKRKMDEKAAVLPERRNFEDTLVAVIAENGAGGIELPMIWRKLEERSSHGKIPSSMKHSASRALQRLLRKGRVTKKADLYFMNSEYQPSSDIALTQLLKATDKVMFSYMPLRMVIDKDELAIEENDAFSHKIYV
ncbi:SWM histone demethylase complex subunit phf1 [Wickerhamiella sorbophila]|uniref:SWM histone demethylase complex subunit phf1 n=1 Tax=Wickerhamiella sorbophila TaxID=45607 RepID=A0A2T0FMM6_9ASCO|nr:SWM histone demethylase complex subunit phf1 [Wickerhamiella sorbophila]PRT56244.1 SWM histone demethylase complex subunit phf1 [Wickerhamiella sorbophila]